MGEFTHNMDKPALSFLSGLLDITIVKPLIEACTGEDLITGEDLSDTDKILKVAFAVLDLVTLGKAMAATGITKLGAKETIKQLGRVAVIELGTNAAGYTINAAGEQLKLPTWMTLLLSIGGAAATNQLLEKKLLKSQHIKIDDVIKNGSEEVDVSVKQETFDKFHEIASVEKWNTVDMQKEFVETFDMYAERAVAEGVCKSKTDFYKMYTNRDYLYTEEYIEKIKEPYLKGGASSIVNEEAIENAFDMYGTVGRGKDGNFTTSCIEDSKLCFGEDGIKSASDIAQIKGVGPNTYKSGMYQYEYDPKFIKSCNDAGIIRTPNGDIGGASSLNIHGCKTWAGYNIEYSESELMMPSIKTAGYDSDDVFSAIEDNGYFEITNPTVITSDGTEMIVEGKFKIKRLGD